MMTIMRQYSLDIGIWAKLYVKLFVILPGITSDYDGTNWREDYRGILARSGKSLDVKLLLSALQQSLEFEYYLEKRFSQAVFFQSNEIDNKERESLDTVSSTVEER